MNKKVAFFIALPVLLVLLFPMYQPQGVSLERNIGFIGNERNKKLIKLNAHVFRGVWFSPDGGVTHRKYYETFHITGEGDQAIINGIEGTSYQVDENIQCIGTRYYDSGTVFVSNDQNTIIVSISKNWYGNFEQAYVNGIYQRNKKNE
ncbi:MAG: hypothetical protein ABW149_03230 [Sedimenticola sp.]